MSTTVQTFITSLDSLYPNAYSNANKLKWVNDIELAVYEDLIKEYRVQYYNRTKGVYQLTLPSGCIWEDAHAVWVEDEKYKKRSVMHHNENRSFYYDNSKLNLYPIPDESDPEYVSGASEITFKAISYTSGADEFTFAADTITTTGASFTAAGFVDNMTIDITGCLDNTGNNGRFTIDTVTADVITIDGTFEAGAESGTVNIKTNCIYTTGSEFSGFLVDEVALVSGCTDETANNKYAVIVAVADDVLTFAEGTFTAQVETAAVTIEQPTIKLVYKYRRTAKLIAAIATDTLLLPDRFDNAYYYYCYAQMSLLNREYQEANNYSIMYNQLYSELKIWYDSNKEEDHNVLLDSSWGLEYN